VQPSWWGPSDALLERLQRSEQVGNIHQPPLSRPVLPTLAPRQGESERSESREPWTRASPCFPTPCSVRRRYVLLV